jgi:DNA-binding MarR family transcriptional regulator
MAAQPAQPGPSAELAGDAWRLLASFMFRLGGRHMAAAVRASGLNPGAVKALYSLDPENPRPMRSLADDWGCDASNVTWLVDRLEERGFVERQTLPTDRRVRTVVLTPAGIDMREQIEEMWSDAPGVLSDLSVNDLESLIAVLRKIVPN